MKRRFSDQRDSSRSRQGNDSHSIQPLNREHTHPAAAAEKPPSILPSIESSDYGQSRRMSSRAPPITPRQITFRDVSPEASSSSPRRPSVTDNPGASASKTSQYRSSNLALGQGRTYNSSPLVPKFVEFQKHDPLQSSESIQGVEGTESSTSAAPSTVWDELDDIKSRIHRLELTGKAPSTSGAAMSRASDDRPLTAATNATTMSASPKRGSGNATVQPDASSTTSSQRESQPLLMSALTKTKSLISAEVFGAIEAAATDALALSSMMGTPGQPGPISSGASTIGLAGNVTDRQLRRKADSICRSLTELCIALADEVGQARGAQQMLASREKEREVMMSPTPAKPAPATSQRRPSTFATADPPAPKAVMSPRAQTTLEQRRLSMLSPATMSSSRFTLTPSTPMDNATAGRKSSLLLARTRRAGTEEPEETSGRRSSLLLRTRRAGTEEPEDNREGRKTSLLLRTRKGAHEDEEFRFRVPSRTVMDLNTSRAASRDANTSGPASPVESNLLGSPALPRRRLIPSSLNARLAASSASVNTSNRRYLDRPAPGRESNTMIDTLSDERGQRQLSLSQTAMLNRTGSISRRPRESSISVHSLRNTPAGGYR